MAVSLTDLEYDADGSVMGSYRVVHRHRVNGWIGAVEFLEGVAQDVQGPKLRHLIAAAGPDLEKVERMDANRHETDAEDQLATEERVASLPLNALRELPTDAEEQLSKERQDAEDATEEGQKEAQQPSRKRRR